MGWRLLEKGKNTKFTSKDTILDQMGERRPLPMGRQEFEDWSDRIIAGAMLSADKDSQKFALADMILHLGPSEDHKEDAHFIKYLRKVACNQVADAMRKELHDKAKARLAEEESKKVKLEVVPQPTTIDAQSQILADKKV